MSTGLALLDDMVLMARAAAASMDDIAAGAAKASAKSAGVIIDDAAVTPQYVSGITPRRELAIVWAIAKGSLRNKLLFIIPAALVLTWLAPWALPVLLILGGSYLVFEGAEKVFGWFGLHHEKHHIQGAGGTAIDEKKVIRSAVRTDLVLSTEIMLISLSALELTDSGNWIAKTFALLLIALGMTLAVYGSVALLVKMDDIGIHLLKKDNRVVKRIGANIVKAMPGVFKFLSIVGTVAMLWVGGHLLWKSAGDLGFTFAYDTLHAVEDFLKPYGDFPAWLGDTLISAIIGLLVGSIFALIFMGFTRLKRKSNKAEGVTHVS